MNIPRRTAAGLSLALTACTAGPQLRLRPGEVYDPESASQRALGWLGAETEGPQTDGSVVRCVRGVREKASTVVKDFLIQRIEDEVDRNVFVCGDQCEDIIDQHLLLAGPRPTSDREKCDMLQEECLEKRSAGKRSELGGLCDMLCGQVSVWTSGLISETVFPSHHIDGNGPYTICGRGGRKDRFGGIVQPWPTRRIQHR